MLPFGHNPTRAALTYQPRGQYGFTNQDAINVMDELAMFDPHDLNAAGRDLAEAWKNGNAQIRDFAHAGGPDSRVHITVQMTRTNGTTRSFHVPVVWDNAWRFSPYEGNGVTG